MSARCLFGRFSAAVLGLVLSACAPPQSPPADPLAPQPSLASACEGKDGWSDPAPPTRVFGNVYYVGTCGISVLLITGNEGHILIDGATEEAVPHILANIRALGFDPREVKLILNSHEHIDHAGGFAALKAATGARIAVRLPAAPVLESGEPDAADPQVGLLPAMRPVRVDRTLTDREVVRLGTIALTVIATPGHTDGGTSWAWRSCEGGTCHDFVYADSMTAVSADSYRFSDHPERVAPFRETFDRIASLDCDVLITPHPSFSDLFTRLSGEAPLADAGACTRLADAMRQRLERRLTEERARP